jgi:hypothetical protein
VRDRRGDDWAVVLQLLPASVIPTLDREDLWLYSRPTLWSASTRS